MFISPDMREMNLAHGYRAQTQMGSLLMYYAIERAAYEAANGIQGKGRNDLKEFLASLRSKSDSKAPVFVFGSVFGGTGASSIPVLPRALDKANVILDGKEGEITQNHDFGSIVLTNYFNFTVDSNDEVVARSENFSINSQSALMFYEEDPTIAATYKRLYLLGRKNPRNVVDPVTGGSRGVTGGGDQRNPADYIELLAAFAAYHFFKEAEKGNAFGPDQKRFYCLAHNFGANKLDFNLFAQEDAEVFKKKIGALTVASLLDMKGTDFFVSVANDKNVFESVNANGEQMEALHQYLAMFNYGIDANDNLVKGWLPQMNAGCGGQGILFHDGLFSCKTLKDLRNFKYNKNLFVGDNPPRFDVGLLSSIFNTVREKFSKTDSEKRNNFDELVSRTYQTINELYFKK